MADNRLASQIGRRITLPGYFDVPVTLEDVRALGADGSAGYECRVRLPDGTLEEAVISPAEAATIFNQERLEACPTVKPADTEKLRLLIESARIRLAYAHDRQFAVSLSGIRTLPHQIEAVYQAMLPQPRLRFLLADDPGAGKTIMAGLLIKELKLREAIERVLILCPAPLTIQWQDEMLRWFGEPFDIIFSAVDQQQFTNPWQRSSQVIASIDYAKQDEVRERVWQQRWDLVVVDEAHKCSARTTSGGQGREPKVATTKRYDIVSRLTSQADHILLLTATPHHGDEDKFSHFLRLIDPDLFPEPHRLGKQATSIRKEVFKLGKDSPWSLRRLKEDLKDLNGNRLFPDRHAKTVTFRLNGEEYALYKSVTAYINEFIPVAQASSSGGQRRSAAALTRTVLQRRLVSSTCAIHESLKRRLKKQQDLLDELERLSPDQEQAMLMAAEVAGKPEYKLPADEARKLVDELQRGRTERIDGLSRLGIARTGPVRHVATTIVLAPCADTERQLTDVADELDPNVRRRSELAAEDMVVAALREEGFPGDRIERVGHLKLGFDVRAHRISDSATGDVFVKRVEVKGRMRNQAVRLTTNEWYKAQQLAETYWLYVVWDPLGATPELVRIQNPAARLDHAKREIVSARLFEIPADVVVAVGQQAGTHEE